MPYRPHASTPGIYDWYLSNAGSMIPDSLILSLPAWTRKTILSTPVWKWFGLFVVLVLLIGAMLLIYRAERKIVQKMRQTSLFGYLVSLLFPIAAISLPVLAKRIVTDQLALRSDLLNFVIIFLDLAILVALIVVVIGVGSRVAAMIIARPQIHAKGLDAQFIRVACRLTSLVAAVVVFLEGGQQLGIPLSTLLAGAGVGGLAFALAAQDTLKNLFGSMMIFLDKPYRVGERIVTKGIRWHGRGNRTPLDTSPFAHRASGDHTQRGHGPQPYREHRPSATHSPLHECRLKSRGRRPTRCSKRSRSFAVCLPITRVWITSIRHGSTSTNSIATHSG